MSTRWGKGALKRDCVYTPTIWNDIPASSQGSKRRKLENNDPIAESSDKKRSEEDRESTASSESTPSSSKRFFTKNGDREHMAVAFHLSRREAELDQWRRLVVKGKAAAPPPEAENQSPSSLDCSFSGKKCSHSPPPEKLASPGASEESFGGDWVDDVVADELLGGGSSTVMTSPQNTTAADQANSSKGDPAMTKHQW